MASLRSRFQLFCPLAESGGADRSGEDSSGPGPRECKDATAVYSLCEGRGGRARGEEREQGWKRQDAGIDSVIGTYSLENLETSSTMAICPDHSHPENPTSGAGQVIEEWLPDVLGREWATEKVAETQYWLL